MNLKTLIPLELSHIGKPFFVRFRSIKLAIQKVFCKILWVFRLPCTAMIGVFNSGFDVPSPTNSQYSLIIDVNVVVVGQVISDAPIPFVRILYVDLLYFFRNNFIFNGSPARFARSPFIVRRTGHMKQLAGSVDGAAEILMAVSDGNVYTTLPYLR